MQLVEHETKPELRLETTSDYELLFVALDGARRHFRGRRRRNIKAMTAAVLAQTARRVHGEPWPTVVLRDRQADLALEAFELYTAQALAESEITQSECYLVARALAVLDSRSHSVSSADVTGSP
jgi:hypothetical protein